MMYKVVLSTFESLDEIHKCDHSNALSMYCSPKRRWMVVGIQMKVITKYVPVVRCIHSVQLITEGLTSVDGIL